jgi:glycosyltransferase involved in cell wall biosynthesis/acetyltransferase-like isoleucine patch superfamily enzyme
MAGTRVALVCGYLDPTRDGVADYTRRLAVHLRSAGVEPLILTTHAWSAAAGEGGALGVAERWDVRGVVAAARALRRLDVDVVHVQFAPSVFGSSRAVGLLPLLLPRGVPLVVTLHEYGVWSGRGRGRRARSALWSAAERRGYLDRETLLLAPRAARLLVPTPDYLDVLSSRFAHRMPPTREVPIGLNVELTTGDRAHARADVRRQLGAGPEAPLVVFFGFLHPEKGLDRLITAVAHQPGAHLLLIGGAESHSVPGVAAQRLREHLDHVAAACGVQDRVHVTGYLPDSEVSRLLGAADAAAFPFDSGVTRKSGSLLAAFAVGIPVVATAAPGEIHQPSESEGVLRVPPRDTAALSDALRTVLRDRALADRLTRAGRTVAASHDWAAIAAAHAEVYPRAAASRPAVDSSGGTEQGEPSTPTEGNRMSLRKRTLRRAEGLGRVLRRRASALGRPAGARPTEDPSLFRPLVYGDPTRLHIAPTAKVNNALFNLSSGEVTIGEYAFFGHNVSILTGTHDWTTFGAERQVAVPTSGRDIVIEEGVWVSTNATVVAPCRIGAHAVVGVGSLVLRDVEPYTVVAGNPARVLRTIPRPGEPQAPPGDAVDPDAGTSEAVAAG